MATPALCLSPGYAAGQNPAYRPTHRHPVAAATPPSYQPVAAMIDPLRLVPFMPPSLGASPKFSTVPLALTTQ